MYTDSATIKAPKFLCISDEDAQQLIDVYQSAKDEVEANNEELSAMPQRKRDLIAHNARLKPASTLVGLADKFGIGRGTVQKILQSIRV